MRFQDVKPRIGKLAGVFYILTLIFITPILILLDPEFDINFNDFDPLSQLGVSSETILYYNLVMLIDGIFLYLYFDWYLNQSRPKYKYLRGWGVSVQAGKIAGLGQIGLALFFNIDILHSLHIISGILFFGGIAISLLIISLDLQHLSNYESRIQLLIRLTLFICLWGISYPFSFRFTDHIGLWQFVILISMCTWFYIENSSYKRISSVFGKSELTHYTYPINFISKLGLTFGILLIILGFGLYIFPELDPTPCGDITDRKNCHPMDNVITAVAGIILVYISKYIKHFE